MNSAGEVEIMVDNEIAVQNLTKMANQKGYGVKSVKLQNNLYQVVMSVGDVQVQQTETADIDSTKEAYLTCEDSPAIEDLKSMEAQGVEIGGGDYKTMIKNILVNEENYSESMSQVVEPYLAKRCREIWPERMSGKKIHCVIYQADKAQGVIVISHGFTESAEKFVEMIYYFLQNGFHVYMPEHCGHGYSYRLVEDLSLVHIDSFATYIKDLIYVSQIAKKENDGMPLYLYAHSMGGGIGAATAAKAPNLFEKVILTSPMIRPETGSVPWQISKNIAFVMCLQGKAEQYIAGGHPYTEPDVYENSCSASRARFDYYESKRMKNQHLQTCSGSYGWLRGADILNRYLMREAWKHIKVPVLLFQAENDGLVSSEQQELFINKLNSGGQTTGKLLFVPEAKHEIYNSHNHVLENYLEDIFSFI